MLLTTKDIYQAFLDGIKKNSTAIVTPEQFNRIINQWGQDEYMAENIHEAELDAKQLDDMEKLRIATDGEQVYNSVLMNPIAPDANNSLSFTIPKYVYTGIRVRLSNGTISTQNFPQYARLMNVMFKVQFDGTDGCNDNGDISDWVKAYIMRADQRSVFLDSTYRKPKHDKLYYEMLDGKIRLIPGTGAVGYALRLEYFRYPVQIFYNKTNPTDTGDPNTGSVNCEFAPNQRKEIVDIAIRTYLERVSDPRYKSFLNEENLRAINQ